MSEKTKSNDPKNGPAKTPTRMSLAERQQAARARRAEFQRLNPQLSGNEALKAMRKQERQAKEHRLKTDAFRAFSQENSDLCNIGQALPPHVFFDHETTRPDDPLSIWPEVSKTHDEQAKYLKYWRLHLPRCVEAANQSKVAKAAGFLLEARRKREPLPADCLEIFCRSAEANHLGVTALYDENHPLWQRVADANGTKLEAGGVAAADAPPGFKGAHPSRWSSDKQLSLLRFMRKHDASPLIDRQIAVAVKAMPGNPSERTTKDNLAVLRKVGWARADGKNGTVLTESGRKEVDKLLGKR